MKFAAPDGATPLDRNELAGLRLRHITTRGELDEMEQANIVQGLRWLERRKKGEVLTDSFLRTLHKKLFGEVWSWAGTYRRTEKNIGVAPHQIPVQLSRMLENVRYWVEHETYPPLEIAARFHHRLVQIHLFPNGNGRHARIATDALMLEHFSIEAIQWATGVSPEKDAQRRTQYINALRNADAGDCLALLEFLSG